MEPLVHAALLVVSLCFGTTYVVGKFALRAISPVGLVVLRAWGTVAIFVAVGALRRPKAVRPKLKAAEFGELFLYSMLGVAINQVCFLEGLSRSTATDAGIMQVLIPLLTLAFAVALRVERVSLRPILGIVVGLSGGLLLILPRGGIDVSSHTAGGNLFLLASGSSYALYLVLTRSILRRHDPLTVVTWVFLFGALVITPVGLRSVLELITSGASSVGWACIAFVIVGGTALPYLLNNWALARVKSSVVAVYILLQPLVAASLGRLILHERLGPNGAVAAALVIAGVALSAWRRGPRETSPPAAGLSILNRHEEEPANG